MVKFLMLLVALPMVAFASKGGGGGLGVACYKNEELTSVQLLDLYEARAKGFTIRTDLTGDTYKDAATIVMKIYKSQEEAVTQLTTVREITKKYKSIPSDSELQPTNDAFPVFLPRGCKTVQVANYYNDTTIWIDQILFDKMSYVDQVALAFHEMIYAAERANGVSNSRYTRTIVGHAFSNQDPFDVIFDNQDPYTKKSCVTADKKTFFYASQTDKEKNIWKFDFRYINGHRVFSKKSAEFELFKGFTIPGWDGENSAPVTSKKILMSKINSNEEMTIYSDKTITKLNWKGTDPEDVQSDTFTCN